MHSAMLCVWLCGSAFMAITEHRVEKDLWWATLLSPFWPFWLLVACIRAACVMFRDGVGASWGLK